MVIKNNGILFIPVICGGLCFLSLFFWLDSVISDDHSLLFYSSTLFCVFLASLLIFYMSLCSMLVEQMTALLLSAYYTHRVIVLYFLPDQFYYKKISVTAEGLYITSLYYLVFVLAISIGFYFGRYRFIKSGNNVLYQPVAESLDNHSDCSYISLFGLKVEQNRLFSIALKIYILASIVSIINMLLGFGVKGQIYDQYGPIDSARKALVDMSPVLSLYALYAIFSHPDNRRLKRLAQLSLVFFLLQGIIHSSRGFVFSILIVYILVMRLERRPIAKYFYVVAGLGVTFIIFVFFPFITVLRAYMLSGSVYVDSFTDIFMSAILSFSERLGLYDVLYLYLNVSVWDYVSYSPLLQEVIDLINNLVIGDIITPSEYINLSKVQVLMGGGYVDLLEIGGHAENQGGLVSPYIYFGQLGALFYLALWSFLLIKLEKSHIHPFWRIALINSYLVSFMSGGGFVVMHNTLLVFFIYSFILFLFVKISVSLHLK